MTTAPDLFRRRRARIAFGAVMSSSVIVYPLSGLLSDRPEWAGLAVLAVPALFSLAVLAWGLARFAPLVLSRRRAPAASSITAVSERFFGATGPGLEKSSLLWPTVGLSLALPLALHWAFVMADPCDAAPRDYAQWVLLSCVIVGHVHVVVAFLSARYVQALVISPDDIRPGKEGIKTALHATWVAAIPGVVLLAYPPLLTFVTATVIFPALYTWTRRTLLKERRLLEEPALSTAAGRSQGGGAGPAGVGLSLRRPRALRRVRSRR